VPELPERDAAWSFSSLSAANQGVDIQGVDSNLFVKSVIPIIRRHQEIFKFERKVCIPRGKYIWSKQFKEDMEPERKFVLSQPNASKHKAAGAYTHWGLTETTI
jgi:hypothetical protein